ncbi:hypothetical protein ABIA24_002581 [Sinorhizobium fredii]
MALRCRSRNKPQRMFGGNDASLEPQIADRLVLDVEQDGSLPLLEFSDPIAALDLRERPFLVSDFRMQLADVTIGGIDRFLQPGEFEPELRLVHAGEQGFGFSAGGGAEPGQ